MRKYFILLPLMMLSAGPALAQASGIGIGVRYCVPTWGKKSRTEVGCSCTPGGVVEIGPASRRVGLFRQEGGGGVGRAWEARTEGEMPKAKGRPRG